MVRRLLPKLTNFGTGGKTRGPSQEALFSFGLPPDDLPPKAANVPVNTPTAKKPKYISAAGCRTSWCNKIDLSAVIHAHHNQQEQNRHEKRYL